MKLIRVFGLVLGAHLTAMAVLLLQPGCQSAQPTPSPESTMADDNTVVAPVDGDLSAPMGSTAPGRFTPMRPEVEEDLSADVDGDPFNSDLSTLQPLDQMTESTIYKVSRGDTLSGIARKKGVSLDSLLAINGLTKKSTIYVGQELVVPAGSGSSVSTVDVNAPANSYKVQRGDTLGGIARRYGIKVSELKAMNGLRKDTIYIGQKLTVPDGSGYVAPAPKSSSATSYDGLTYKVRSGDTLGGIARRYGVKVAQIKALNGMSKDVIYANQVLKLPAGASAKNVAPKTTTVSKPSVSVKTTSDSAPTAIRIEPGKPAETESFNDLENLIPAQDEEIPLIPMDNALPAEEEAPEALPLD